MPDDLRQPAALVHYDAARRALAEAVRIDDVKQIRDLAVAAQVYARQAQDFDMINNATELRERAERRGGEVLIEMRDRGDRDEGQGGDRRSQSPSATVKLADLGITRTQSSRWQAKAKLSDAEFEKHVQQVKRKAVDAAAKPTTELKRQRRADKEASLAEATKAASRALGSQLYGVIYADPPWRFEPYSRDTGMDRAAENHYPTMSLDGLRGLSVPAAENCVLFLWTTVPMLAEALKLIAHWGFNYKSSAYWMKPRAGTGYWYRNHVEQLLVATRGDIPAPAPGRQPPQVHAASAAEHSAKPDAFARDIAAMFPNVPKLEMFARRRREGWDIWGNEA